MSREGRPSAQGKLHQTNPHLCLGIARGQDHSGRAWVCLPGLGAPQEPAESHESSGSSVGSTKGERKGHIGGKSSQEPGGMGRKIRRTAKLEGREEAGGSHMLGLTWGRSWHHLQGPSLPEPASPASRAWG